jgi:methionyl-tRNA synthetase
VHRYCGGVVPAADATLMRRDVERTLIAGVAALVEKVKSAVTTFQLSVALREIWEIVGASNRYIVTREPWKLAKTGPQPELDTALYVAADTLRVIAELIRPFMPGTGDRTLRMLGVTPAAASWSTLAPGTLKPGTRMGESSALFPRIEQSVEELRAMADGTHAPSNPSTQAPSNPSTEEPARSQISIDDFMRVELRVAKVLAAERVPKSNKLLKLQVDTGVDQRTIVAGIAEAYEPESIVGRSIAIVFNLKPAKLMGVESNGMVLAASAEGGKPQLVTFDDPPQPGTRIR